MDRDTILANIKKAPDYDTDHATWVDQLLTAAMNFVVSECNLPRFPFLSQGYSQSASSPETDLTSLSNNTIYVSINHSRHEEISLTLANCDSGANTAAEFQTQLQSLVSLEQSWTDYFSKATVLYSDSLYTITSPTYGNESVVKVAWAPGEMDVAHALKLSPYFGGVELPGSKDDEELASITEDLVLRAYREARLAPEMYERQVDYALNRAFQLISDRTLRVLRAKRRLRL